LDVSASLLAGFPEVVGESSRGMMVLLVKQVHLQKDVGEAASATERNVRKSSTYCHTDLRAIVLFALLE